MSETRRALIIANSRYEHPGLSQLQAPTQDAESLARVLADPAIGGFEVRTLFNELSHKVNLEIENFFDNRKHDDLLLLYFSGHGIKNEDDGRLYLATVDTQLADHNVRRATAVSSHFINEVMSQSHSRRQILLLDCCYSGAFKEGMIAKGDHKAGEREQFQGQGRIVLTASDALQFSFEGEQVKGEGMRSVFTSALVRGLETGEADLDRDGYYTLDEVYDYVYANITEHQPGQKPTKIGFVEGKIFLGSNPHPTIAQLPEDLQETLEDRRQFVRLGAVHELERLLTGSNKGLTRAARAALENLARNDDSYEVRRSAEKCLGKVVEETSQPPRPEEPPREERNRLKTDGALAGELEASQQARIAREKADRERLAKQEAERAAGERISSQGAAGQKSGVTAARRGAADFIDTMFMVVFVLLSERFGSVVLGIIGLAVALLVCARISTTGKTPGHLLTGTQIVDEQGKRLTFMRSLVYLIAWYPIGTFFLGLATLLTVRNTQRHIALYDLLAHTTVLRDTR